MTKVKICGITRREDLESAVDAGADALGFVVGVPISPRNLPNEKATELVDLVPDNIQSTIVTTLRTEGELREVCKVVKAKAIQLHGLKQYPSFLKTEFGLKVIGAIKAEPLSALDSALEASQVC
ncbi:MAG: hypothetical protein ACE5KG_02945, partial [Nitrososphaerales archaeon]